MNSLKSLHSRENAALDSMELLDCDKTWLEIAKDNVSSKPMTLTRVFYTLLVLSKAYLFCRHLKQKMKNMQHSRQI